MADTAANQTPTRKESGQTVARRDQQENRGLRRSDPAFAHPLDFMDRMTDEMDRWFDRVSRDLGFPRRSWLSRDMFGTQPRQGMWAPRIEAFQKGDRFTVRAELPGMKKDDIEVELTDDALTIRGERSEERQQERGGYYHSEREYGDFYRTIPLPDGVIGESAHASFRDGVLEVTMQAAPSEANRGRKVDITDAPSTERKK
jgi:HSP20 family protein